MADKPVQASVELITPEVAEKMLASMVKNRPLSAAKELEYGISMEQGKWVVNGESIKFDGLGRLFDGQHRLKACVLAGKSFRSLVVRGIVDPDAFSTVDVGKNRSHADIFSIAGFVQAKDASSVAMLLYLFKNNKLDWRGPTGLRARVGRERSEITKRMRVMPYIASLVSKEILLEFAEPLSEGISSAVRFAVCTKANKLMPISLIGAGYYLFREKSFDDAEQFFYAVGEGLNFEDSKSDPAYWLREKLIDNKSAKLKLNRWTMFGFLLKCWNKRRANETMRLLRVQEGEEFPNRVL